MRTPKPQIDQIKIKETTYDINVPKSWAQNDPTHVQYIKDRTHYQELLEGDKLPAEEVATAIYSFKNIYVGSTQVYTDHWVPSQSWIYPKKPCEHLTAADHAADLTCAAEGSGGKYLLDFSIDITIGTTVESIYLIQNKEITLFPYALDENGDDNSQQIIASFKNLTTTLPTGVPDDARKQVEAWANSVLYYHTAGYFYLENEPKSSSVESGATNSSRPNYFRIKPIEAEDATGKKRQYLCTKRLDAAFLPLDNKTVKIDDNGNLSAEAVYGGDFQVTEQFGRYEPLEWVPAKGRSIQDVLDDAFCTDKQPAAVDPEVEFYVQAQEACYEVGSTVTLDWEVRLNPGSYTYGILNPQGDFAAESLNGTPTGNKAYSNYYATEYTIDTTSGIAFDENINEDQAVASDFELSFDNFATKVENLTDNHLIPNESGKKYRILAQDSVSEPTQVTLPKRPISQFNLPLSVAGDLDTSYPSATMLKKASNPEIRFKNYAKLYNTAKNILTSDYRWFWTYSSEEANVDVESADIRNYNSQLGSFPAKIQTKQMRSMCFFLPKARAKYLDSGELETSVTIKNEATGAKAYKKIDTQVVSVEDANGNPHQYIMYYFTNEAPDSATNTYEILVADLYEKGGNS